MKRLLVFVLVSISLFGFSQESNKMNFKNGEVFYNGNVIKFKKAKKIAKEKCPDAFKHFRIASIKRGITIVWGITAGASTVGIIDNAITDPDAAQIISSAWSVSNLGIVILWSETSRKLDIEKGIQVFNETNWE